MPDGRLVALPGGFGRGTNFRAEYNHQDHLGNTRLGFCDFNGNGRVEINEEELEITQEKHYYPFGLQHNGEWYATVTPNNEYLYNGKELNRDWDINLYEYGARWHDPAIGRFIGVDPIADQFAWVNAYNYAENSPVTYIDLWGLQKAMLRPGETQQDIKQRNAFDRAVREAIKSKYMDNNKKGYAVVLSPDLKQDIDPDRVPGGIAYFAMHGSEDGRLISKDGKDKQTEIRDLIVETEIDKIEDVNILIFGLCFGSNCNLERFADYSGLPLLTTGKEKTNADKITGWGDLNADSYTLYGPQDSEGNRNSITLKREDFGTAKWNEILNSFGVGTKNEQEKP